MSSTLQIAASRANGAKSRGPVTVSGKLKSLANSALSTGPRTPEGKARSSRNALRHGILAESVVLDNESAQAFSEILSALQDELRPASPIENRFVETMALAEWRRLRLLCMEKEQLAMEMHRQENSGPDTILNLGAQENPAPVAVNSLRSTVTAFRALADQSRAQDLLNRYEVRHDRQYMRALAALHAHRAERRRFDRDVRKEERLRKARLRMRKVRRSQKMANKNAGTK